MRIVWTLNLLIAMFVSLFACLFEREEENRGNFWNCRQDRESF